MKPIFKLVALIVIITFTIWLVWPINNNQKIISTIEPRDLVSTDIKIIAFGDSLTAGYNLSNDESYPAQLENILKSRGYSVTVINAGVSGETSRGNLERADFISEQNPDIVLLGIGGNDALRSLPIKETKNNIINTINILKTNPNPPVIILLQMQAPLNSGLAYKKQFDEIYPEIVDETDVLLVSFITTEIYFDPQNKLPDGIHLNKIGYRKVIDNYLLPDLIKVLDKITND